jgi:hypothetical protein
MVDIEYIRLAVSALTPFAVVVLGYVFNRRLKQYQVQRERERAEIERRHKLRIEFTLDATFYGPKRGYYLSEFSINVHNKSRVKYDFTRITLRVRGLKEDDVPTLWKDREPRLAFPHKLFETNTVPEGLGSIFVEPEVNQPVTFVTRIDDAYDYILGRAEFYYGQSGDEEFGPHSVERLFALEPANAS